MNTYHQQTSKTISVGWFIRCGAVFLVVGAACVGYLFQKESLHKKAEEVEKLERELRLLKRENELRHQAYAALISPKQLELEVRRRALNLVAPQPEDILSLPLPSAESVKSQAGRLKASPSGPSSRASGTGIAMDSGRTRYIP
jgi:uncharacterized protein HemX